MRRPSSWSLTLVVGLVLVAAYLPASGPLDGVLAELIYVVVAGGGALVAVTTAVRRTERRVAWWLIGLGLASSALGELLWTVHVLREGTDPPFPFVADGPYLAGWIAIVAGVVLLVRDPDRSRRLAAWLDAGVLTLASAVLMWLVVVADLVRDEELTGLALAVALAYPVLDVALLAVIAALLLDQRRSSPALLLIALGVGAQLVADVVFAAAIPLGTYESGDPADLGWLLAYLLIAVAALHPSSDAVGRIGAAPEALSHRRVLLLWFAVLATTVVATVAGYPTDEDSARAAYAHVAVGSAATVLMATLVLWRLALAASTLSASLEARDELQRRLQHQADHDPLTGLANRRRFTSALRETTGGRAAVLFVDLDRFKDINDRLGHAAGDEVLRIVAARLTGALRPGDVAARMGGDEFAALIRGARAVDVDEVADRLLELLRAPMVLGDGTTVRIDGSVGTAGADSALAATRDLVQDADAAMYEAKRAGRSRVTAYSPEVHAQVSARRGLQSDLRDAVEREQLHVVYQPIVAVDDRRPVGVEALLRWQHPTRGPISPVDFIPLAEASGDIIEIGRWVLQEACRTIGDLVDEVGPLVVNVNVSALQLHDGGFAATVDRVLAETGFDPRSLTLEITESVLLEDAPVVRANVERLRAQGVRFAVDDFGTGFSALRYLRDVPLDELKIDRSFVAGLDAGPEDAALAYAILHLADNFSLETVGEGVETETQFAELASRGCGLAQGYLFSKPLPVDDLVAWLTAVGPARVAAGRPPTGAVPR